jgi:hypothetical protein
MTKLFPLALIGAALTAPANALEVGEIFSLDQNRPMATRTCATLEELRSEIRPDKCGAPFTGQNYQVVQKSGDAVCIRAAGYPNDRCAWAVIAPNVLMAAKPTPPRPPVAEQPAVANNNPDANVPTQLQLQFQRWLYEGNGLVTIVTTQRNPTEKPFSVSSWNCKFYNKEGQPVGYAPITFHNVPWGALIVEKVTVALGGMFEDADCKLAYTEDVTWENEKIYPPHSLYQRQTVGLGLVDDSFPFWSFQHKIHGRAKILSVEESKELHRNIDQWKGNKPGYR